MPELVEYLYEAGPFEYGGMGPVPLSWQTLSAWSEVSGIELDAFESTAIRELSMSYVDQLERGKNPTCPAPWLDEEQVNREQISDKLLTSFRAFNERRKKRK